jgi:hypothetical protein
MSIGYVALARLSTGPRVLSEEVSVRPEVFAQPEEVSRTSGKGGSGQTGGV